MGNWLFDLGEVAMAGPGRLPDLVTPGGRWARLFWKLCPACGKKFWNGPGQMSVTGYPLHYATAHMGIRPFRLP